MYPRMLGHQKFLYHFKQILFLSTQIVTSRYSVVAFKTSAGYMDNLMSVGIIKAATSIWICWITIKKSYLSKTWKILV